MRRCGISQPPLRKFERCCELTEQTPLYEEVVDGYDLNKWAYIAAVFPFE